MDNLSKQNGRCEQETLETRKGLSIKTLVIGIIAIVIVAYSSAQWLVNKTYLHFHYMPPSGAVAVIFLLLVANAITSALFRGKKLVTRGEMITVYSMVLVAGVTLSYGLMQFLPIIVVNLRMKAMDLPKLWGNYSNQISSLIAPTSEDAVFGFFEGGMKVPWSDWVGPIVIWFLFWGVAFFVHMCIATLFRKFWTDIERLRYPLTVVPMAITEERHDSVPAFWRTRLAYIGMVIPAIMGTMNIINMFAPAMPAFPSELDLGKFFTDYPFNILGDAFMVPWRLTWDPLVIGVGYIIPLDVTFSMWFFFTMYRVVYPVILNIQGLYLKNHLPLHRVHLNGAVIGYGLVVIWLSRAHLLGVFKKAFTGMGSIEHSDANEPMSYRMAVFGFLLGTIFLLLFGGIFLHVGFLMMLGFLIIMYLGAIAFARSRSEAGYTFNTANMSATYYLTWAISPENLGTSSLGLAFMLPFDYGYFDANSELALQAFKMGDLTNIKRSSMLKALCIAFALAFVLGWLIYLPIVYDKGAYILAGQFAYQGNAAFNNANASAVFGSANPLVLPHAVFAAVSAALLGYMRSLFVWWPFNPIGFVLANNDWMWGTWGPMFIAWLLKFGMLRYGGAQTYKKCLPFFLGLMVGSIIFNLLGSLIAMIY